MRSTGRYKVIYDDGEEIEVEPGLGAVIAVEEKFKGPANRLLHSPSHAWEKHYAFLVYESLDRRDRRGLRFGDWVHIVEDLRRVDLPIFSVECDACGDVSRQTLEALFERSAELDQSLNGHNPDMEVSSERKDDSDHKDPFPKSRAGRIG